MKKIILLLFASLACLPAVRAQKLIIGERAPELRVKEWIENTPPEGKTRLVEFFHPGSKPSMDRLPVLNGLAKKYAGKLTVIVVTREPKEKVSPVLAGKSYAFFSGLDDAGKTFAAFDVQYIPFSVLIDAKGRTRWFGNSSFLTEEIIGQNL